MSHADQTSPHGPSWSKQSFLAAVATSADRALAARLFELHDSLRDSYYWLGQRPNGGIYLHPLGLRYSPMSLWIHASGELMGRGTWRRYPEIRGHHGFSELATFVGMDHDGLAAGFPVAEVDVEHLWAHAMRCAQHINA
jgi:hypothetical protein